MIHADSRGVIRCIFSQVRSFFAAVFGDEAFGEVSAALARPPAHTCLRVSTTRQPDVEVCSECMHWRRLFPGTRTTLGCGRQATDGSFLSAPRPESAEPPQRSPRRADPGGRPAVLRAAGPPAERPRVPPRRGARWRRAGPRVLTPRAPRAAGGRLPRVRRGRASRRGRVRAGRPRGLEGHLAGVARGRRRRPRAPRRRQLVRDPPGHGPRRRARRRRRRRGGLPRLPPRARRRGHRGATQGGAL